MARPFVTRDLLLGANRGPSLDIDFLSPNLAAMVSVSRASTESYFDATGTLQSAAANVSPLDYDPATLLPRGRPIWEARTNLITYSEQLDNAAWTKTRATAAASASAAPDGATTADKIVEDATAANTHYIQTSAPTAASGTAYTFSCFVKAAERTQAAVLITGMGAGDNGAMFNLSTGAYISSIGTVDSYSSSNCGKGWWRLTVTKAASTSTAHAGRVYCASAGSITYDGDPASGVYAWGAQLEAGSFATPYIPTVASQATRPADNLSMLLSAFGFNASEGTICCEVASTETTGAKAFAYYFDDTTSNNSIYSDVSGGNRRGVVFSGGVAQAAIAMGAITSGVAAKTAFAYKANDFAASLNGGAVVTDTAGSVPTVTRLALGNNFALNAATNGWLRRLRYWPYRLSNSELQALTS